jgi:putative endonuclease
VDRDPRHRLGASGEEFAERMLCRSGFRILARRYRIREGEVDLVALDGEVVVFVEVKTRSGRTIAPPAEFVTASKRRRLVRAAAAWLAGRNWLDRRCRFDVVELVAREKGGFEVRHLRDAFRPRSG